MSEDEHAGDRQVGVVEEKVKEGVSPEAVSEADHDAEGDANENKQGKGENEIVHEGIACDSCKVATYQYLIWRALLMN